MKTSPDSPLVLSPPQAARAAKEFRAAVARHESQKELAAALGVSQQAISEACKGKVSLGLAALLAESMGIRVGGIIGGRDPSP